MKRIRKKFVNERNGFTLVEVLAAIVIISIILIGVVNLLNFTNKTAYSNNAKLVSINLAKATMERIKIQPDQFFNKDDVTEEEVLYTSNTCKPKDCQSVYKLYVNDQTYNVEVKVRQNKDEETLQLINTVVTVKLASDDQRMIESTVEGYVNLTKANFDSNDGDAND